MNEGRRKRWGISRELAVHLLYRHGVLTRAELARRIGVSRSAITEVVSGLLAEEVVVEDVTAVGGVDAPQAMPGTGLALNPGLAQSVGIDFAHDHLRVVITDLRHQVLAEADQPLAIDHDADDAVQLAANLVQHVLSDVPVASRGVVGVGVGIPGPIDWSHRTATRSSISSSWIGFDVAGVLSRRLGFPILIDNNANVGGLAETLCGAARGLHHVVYVKAAAGIGAGIVINGQLFRGAAGMAGEIGHMTIDDGGPLCRCGNRGCLEVYAGSHTQLALVQGSMPSIHSYPDMLARAQAGDPGCRRVLADAGRYLGIGIASLCNVINPEIVVLGGDLAEVFNLVSGPIENAISRNALHLAAESVRLVPGLLGAQAEAIGASQLVFQEGGALTELVNGPGNGSPERALLSHGSSGAGPHSLAGGDPTVINHRRSLSE